MNRILALLLSTLLLSTLNCFSWSTGYVIKGWYKEVVETPATGKVVTEVTMDWDKLYEKVVTSSWTIDGGVKSPVITTEAYYWSDRVNPSSFKTKWSISSTYTHSPTNGQYIILSGTEPLRMSGMTPRIGMWQGEGVNNQFNFYTRNVSGDYNLLVKRGPFWDAPGIEDSYALIYFRVNDPVSQAWHYFCAGYHVPSTVDLVIHPQPTDAKPCLGTPVDDVNAAVWAPGGILWTLGTYYGWWSNFPEDRSHSIYKDQNDGQVAIVPIPTYFDVLKNMSKGGPLVFANVDFLTNPVPVVVPIEPGFPGDVGNPLLIEILTPRTNPK